MVMLGYAFVHCVYGGLKVYLLPYHNYIRVNDQLLDLWRNWPWYPLNRRLGGPEGQSECFEEEKNICSCSWELCICILPRTSSSVHCKRKLVHITEVLRL